MLKSAVIPRDELRRETAPQALGLWNGVSAGAAALEILPCCGSREWANRLAALRPFATADDLFAASDSIWSGLSQGDWGEAFESHPRIGERHAATATAASLEWSAGEQAKAISSAEGFDPAEALRDANRRYEEKFGRTFIVCATGRSADEILCILNGRMENNSAAEWLEAGEQQRQITQLRLRRWLGED
jgi:2-oxo-4-hydroxy-4-carboxy-5-ureidoimidazoline decarboxylase